METRGRLMILIVLLDGCDISSLRYKRQRLTVKLDRPVDEPIVVAAARVAPSAKNEVVETVQVKGGKGGRAISPSTDKNRMMGWDNKCYDCGSDNA